MNAVKSVLKLVATLGTGAGILLAILKFLNL